MKICSLHFTKEDCFIISRNSGRKILKKNTVPSQNLPVSSVTKRKSLKENLQRDLRRKNRELRREKRYIQRDDEPLELGQQDVPECEGFANENQITHSADDLEAAHALLNLVKAQPEADEMMSENILQGSTNPLFKASRDAQIQVDVPKVFTLCCVCGLITTI
ncbi:hypothetical protein JTB14_037999 [Gonioctena quinquepunctata]|nr:hypothetical protein JTB14_037999 [Gonioctena quinquepunctata]